jgi:gamma-glutamyltranspeptidase / glutathione hydrolase
MARSHLPAIAVVLVLLTGCSFDLGRTLAIGSATSNAAASVGLVVGDEALAVRAGASVLAHGGNAADAATATYFALAVTYPAAAGLGGGGVCVVHDPVTHRSETIEFPVRPPSAGGAYAVPGNVAGFAILQQRFGALPWQRDVVQAENLAATGFPISHALSARLIRSQNIVRLDASLASEFMDENGQINAAGTEVANPELAATLAQIRTRGASGFYRGDIAARLASYARTQGSELAAEELASASAEAAPPHEVQVGADRALLPAVSSGFASFATASIEALSSGRSGAGAPQPSPVPDVERDQGATGFAASDAAGEAVACSVAMNGVFGTGHTASGTGVTFSGARPDDGVAASFLTPAIAVDGRDDAVFIGAGAGGRRAASAIVEAFAQLSRGERVQNRLPIAGNATGESANFIVCEGACVALPDPASGLGLTSDAAR